MLVHLGGELLELRERHRGAHLHLQRAQLVAQLHLEAVPPLLRLEELRVALVAPGEGEGEG